MDTWASPQLSEAPPQQADRELTAPLRAAFERHAAFVYRCLCYLRVREADLDDALAQVFESAGERLNDRGGLYALCRRVARRRTLALEFSHDPTRAKQREALTFALRLLRLLPEEQREVFVLYEVEDMPTSEIARALDCPVRVIRLLLREARERIVAEVERLAAESDDD